jgi:hypothetical protein
MSTAPFAPGMVGWWSVSHERMVPGAYSEPDVEGVTKWKRLHNAVGQSDGDEFRGCSRSVPTQVKPHSRRTT